MTAKKKPAKKSAMTWEAALKSQPSAQVQQQRRLAQLRCGLEGVIRDATALIERCRTILGQ